MLICTSKVKASTTLRNSHSDGINSCLLVDAAGGAWRCASITWEDSTDELVDTLENYYLIMR